MTLKAGDRLALYSLGLFIDAPAVTNVRESVAYATDSYVGTYDPNATSLLPTGEAEDWLDEWGEEVVYKPAGGGTRDIIAIVNREPPGDLSGAPHGISPILSIAVANDATTGIDSSEVNTGGDKVSLAVRQGESVTDRVIVGIMKQDAVMVTLELR